MLSKIIVLGAGNMGAYIASSLSKEYRVAIVDYNQAALDKIKDENIVRFRSDLSQPANVSQAVSDHDFVVSALPESFGYNAVKAALVSGKNVVDVSFWEQDKHRLSYIKELAKKYNLTALIDCGIAPGLSNALVAYFDDLLQGKTQNVRIYVGGMPEKRERAFFASWSVTGLIDEYTRQALHVRDWKLVKIPALSFIKTIDFPDVGKLDAGITDGLRSLATNLPHIKYMAEFTLRYPGHFQQMKLLEKLGYFDEHLVRTRRDEITAFGFSQLFLNEKPFLNEKDRKCETLLQDLGFYDDSIQYRCPGQSLSPREVAIGVLSKTWKMRTDDRDMLIMRVQADDGKTKYATDIHAKHNGKNSAMALTTGTMAALAARAVVEGKIRKKGVLPLEIAVREEPELIKYFISGLESLGVIYRQNKRALI